MGYSALFLAPGTISTARDPRYIVISKSTKLVNLVISGRLHGKLELVKPREFGHFWLFHGLRRTIFGSGNDFNGP